MSEQKKRRKRKRKKPVKAPPTLGVRVSDAVATEDKPYG